MAKDIFKKPFDEGTQNKLAIFREYLREWLPTFTKRNKIIWKQIFIYDFFAGEGKDSDGKHGSPLIILEELKEHHSAIEQNELQLKVVLNEKIKKTFKKLSQNVAPYESESPYEIVPMNKDFKELFFEIYPSMLKGKEFPRLIFLDQYGIKEVTEEVFRKLTELKRTDFIFFISSSFIRRFNELPEFSDYIKITKVKFDQSRPYHSHRVVFEYYKSLVKDKDYFLAPFSIKKGSNIYGLIFGSNHFFGIEKFMKVAWKLNEHSGDANFNIDEEIFLETGQFSIFAEDNRPRKLTLFEKKLEAAILDGTLRNTVEVYKYSFDQGCLPKHANKVIIKLVAEKRINPVKTATQKIHKLAPEQIKLSL